MLLNSTRMWRLQFSAVAMGFALIAGAAAATTAGPTPDTRSPIHPSSLPVAVLVTGSSPAVAAAPWPAFDTPPTQFVAPIVKPMRRIVLTPVLGPAPSPNVGRVWMLVTAYCADERCCGPSAGASRPAEKPSDIMVVISLRPTQPSLLEPMFVSPVMRAGEQCR